MMLNLIEGFLFAYWDDQVMFVFAFINMLYYIYWFAYVEPPLHPGMKPTWPWWMIFLVCCWIQFAVILLRIFSSMFITEIGL
jgi:hypothetical protein